MTAPVFRAAADFLDRIGVPVQVVLGTTGFLPGLRISGPSILVTEASDDLAGDLLHEAGHIAVTPGVFRPYLDDNVCKVFVRMKAYLDAHPDWCSYPEDPIGRAIMQAGEQEAIAWSFAAAKSAGIDTLLPFRKGFAGAGTQIHADLAVGRHSGVHGLACSGMTDLPRRGNTAPYPKMHRWLQV